MSTSISQHFSPWSLLKFAFSSIIMMMFMSLYTIVDGIFISRFIGSNALSSLNIVYPVASVVIAIGTMLATGGNAVISRYLGEDKQQLAKECLSLFTLVGFLLSLLASILAHLFPDFISRALGANDLLLADCRTLLFTVISLLVLPQFFGVNGAWLAIPVAEDEFTQVMKKEPVISGRQGAADIRHLNQYGNTPSVILGPGLTEQMHANNEWVYVEDYLNAIKILSRTIMRWCGTEE